MSVNGLRNWLRNQRGLGQHLPSEAGVNRRAKRPTGRKACVEALEPRVVLAADVVINEVVASNQLGLLDYDDDSSDWFELHSRASSSVDLQGWHLTDSARNLTKWQIPVSTILAPDERLVVFASGKDFVTPNGELHTDFKFSKDGEFVALVDPDGAIVHSIRPEYPPQATDVSYGLNENVPGAGTFAFFATPTPGAPNSAPFEGFLQPPTFSVASQTFTDEVSLEFTTGETNAVIRYTTNRTVPNESSTPYTTPLTVSTTTQVRARVFRDGFVPSEIVGETYLELAEDVHDFSSDLPIIVIEDFQRRVPIDRAWRNAFMAVFEPDETGRSRLTNSADLTSRIGWHRRGASTFGNPKINMRIETRNEMNRDRDVELLGLPSESDFILFGPFKHDRALVRNPFLFELSRQMGRYASRTRFVEVYGNFRDGELSQSDYLGLYTLEEQIKADENRVNIERISTKHNSQPEVTGGYLLERGSQVFTFSAIDPSVTQITAQQLDYLENFIRDLQTSLFSPNFTDPELGYRAYLDADSAIDHHILRYLGKPIEQFNTSTHFYKDRGGKLNFGPIWDFDKAMGADLDAISKDPVGIEFRTFWFDPMFEDPDFEQQWIDRWQQLRKALFTDENFAAIIDSMAAEIAEAQARNFARWHEVAPNGGEFAEEGLTGWEAEVSHLKGWLSRRMAWTDSLQLAPVSFSSNGGPVNPGHEVTLTAPEGMIYFTLNGSDPRDPGGQISSAAIKYQGQPIFINENTQIMARAFSSTTGLRGWSGPSTANFAVVGEPLIPGDANRDGQFDFDDILQVVAAGKFETGQLASWDDGDWNRDGLFTFDDVLEALATGAYRDSTAALMAAMSGTAVKQPSSASVADGGQEGVADPLPSLAEAGVLGTGVPSYDGIVHPSTLSATQAIVADDQETTLMPDDANEARVIRAKKVVATHPPYSRPLGNPTIWGIRVGKRSSDVSHRVHNGDGVGRRGGESHSLPAEANRLRPARVLPADAVFRQLGERFTDGRPALACCAGSPSKHGLARWTILSSLLSKLGSESGDKRGVPPKRNSSLPRV